ncbi:retron system putative HNH endonuclease [Aromatoleum anaerobium]|uniref:retron system putative HNH endonuclease n=1 Tax=Aromatoleum anaerobium TaxID=182180 RepID=UPI001B7D0A57|nr:retron system putative HNH endonuclease [Aromatoleum anaerobium]MCK0505752.1 TIGR02646 family protein [Aromatoleum anaerobium]
MKGPEPRELLDWKRQNRASPQNLTYTGGGFPREAVKHALMVEQHHLCAYTMRGLKSAADCHIEHVLPQARKNPEETIDYHNMLACYPGSNSKTVCEFGAHAKGDYDPERGPFCSPLHKATPSKFRFSETGEVTGRDDVAQATIEVLRLNHPILVHDREAAIRGGLKPGRRRQFSAAAARRLAAEVRKPDFEGRLRPYCEAIAQAALKYADKEERKARRLRQRRV